MDDVPDFGELRSLLHRPPSPASWGMLCDLIERWPARHVEQVIVPYAARALQRWDDALRVAPTRWVLRACEGHRVPGWGLVRTLRLSPLVIPNLAAARSFASSDELAVVRRLEVEGGSLVEVWFECILAAPMSGRLEALTVSSWELSPSRLTQLLASRSMPGLSRLGLSHDRLDAAALRELLRAPWIDRVRLLDLSHNRLGDDAAWLLARTAPARLEHLNLSHNDIADAGARALLRTMSGLKTLTLQGNRPRHVVARRRW